MCNVPSLPPALLHRDFRRLWTSMLCSGLAMQMAAVAIGWQVYSIHHSAFDLGLIGLAEFLPVPLLALPGRAARRPAAAGRGRLRLGLRRRGGHRAAARRHDPRRAPALAVRRARALATGVGAAFGNPAGRSLVPELVPTELLTGALALRSIGGQISTIAGPAVGGLLFAIQPEAVYVRRDRPARHLVAACSCA